MNTLTKMALGLMGQLKPVPVPGTTIVAMNLPPAEKTGGLPLMQCLQKRQSQRSFEAQELPLQTVSNLLWAVAGVNRQELGGRTTPSAMNAQEIDVYVALGRGLYRYDPFNHTLLLERGTDVRRVTGYQDFVDTAPLELIFVAHHGRMSLVPAAQRNVYAWVAAGAMAQSAYLFCASAGLATVIRAWIDRTALAQAMDLSPDEQVLLAQTVGLPDSQPEA